jgi:hypothetical protein
MRYLTLAALALLLFSSCDKTDNPTNSPKLRFTFKFDPTQQRLGNLGTPVSVPSGNAAQVPDIQAFSVHFIELAKDQFTQFHSGAQVYWGAETSAGGSAAIDHSKAIIADENTVFLEVPLSQIPAGTYQYIRTSAAYQKYSIRFNILNTPLGNVNNQTGTLASFVGFNTYINTVTPVTKTLTVNDDKKQGFWAFETQFTGSLAPYNQLLSGSAPEGATTVPNPLAATADIPLGSCVVVGQFQTPLIITGNETTDINVTLSYSINNSFEWIDTNANQQWDLDATTQTIEPVVDMGLRGLIAKIQ